MTNIKSLILYAFFNTAVLSIASCTIVRCTAARSHRNKFQWGNITQKSCSLVSLALLFSHFLSASTSPTYSNCIYFSLLYIIHPSAVLWSFFLISAGRHIWSRSCTHPHLLSSAGGGVEEMLWSRWRLQLYSCEVPWLTRSASADTHVTFSEFKSVLRKQEIIIYVFYF